MVHASISTGAHDQSLLHVRRKPSIGTRLFYRDQNGRAQFPSPEMSFAVSSATVAGTESRPSSAPSNLSYTSPAVSYSITSTRSLGIPSCEVFKIHRQSPPAQPSKKDALALLSPPTRPKRFIQMKPRRQREEQQQQPKETPTKRRLSSIRAADRKITRNKAHSLVEQRRRVKMNETFAIMKDMIPACTGDMHKLDILQVSDTTRCYVFDY